MQTKNIRSANGSPITLFRDGSSEVKLYSTPREKNGVEYPGFSVAYYEGGVRTQKFFSKQDEAKTHAKNTLVRLVNGLTAAQDMRPVEIEESAMAREEFKSVGVGLLEGAKEYRRVHELLGGKGTVLEAVQYFLKSGVATLPKAKVLDVCRELVAAKKTDGLSQRHQDDLRLRCERFAEDFDVQITEVTTAQIEAWLRGIGAKPRNRNNYARAITTLFNFAKRSGYLPIDCASVAEHLTRAKNVAGATEIFTTEEISTGLDRLFRFKPEYIPFLALAAFSGVRTAELLRLTWGDIDLNGKIIEVAAEKSKTSLRRHIPIQPNLLKWLEPFSQRKGLVCPTAKIQRYVRRWLSKEIKNSDGTVEAGIPWHDNGLRHSYGSYRLPIVKSAAELALEMGNSPAMIFRHYRELVKPAEAQKYWAIMPPAEYAKKMAVALAKLKAGEGKDEAE